MYLRLTKSLSQQIKLKKSRKMCFKFFLTILICDNKRNLKRKIQKFFEKNKKYIKKKIKHGYTSICSIYSAFSSCIISRRVF